MKIPRPLFVEWGVRVALYRRRLGRDVPEGFYPEGGARPVSMLPWLSKRRLVHAAVIASTLVAGALTPLLIALFADSPILGAILTGIFVAVLLSGAYLLWAAWPRLSRMYERFSPTTRARLEQARDMVVIFVVTVTATIVYSKSFHAESEGEKHLVELVIVLFGIIVLLSSVVWRNRMFLGSLNELRQHARGPIGNAMVPYAQSALHRLNLTVREIQNPSGRSLDTTQAQSITELCFESTDAIYDGTDSNVPSEFKRRYPGYLSAHSKNLSRIQQRGPTQGTSTRILVVERAALFRDAETNRSDYEEFVAWHSGHGVRLLYEDPAHAYRIAQAHGLDGTDVGLWRNQFALLFFPEVGGGVRLSMLPASEAHDRYQKVVSYFEELSIHAKDNIVPTDPDLLGDTLSAHWESFAGCDERLREEGAFLLARLGTPGSPILDAATGAGCESVFLKERGYLVISNEIERTLADHARRRAKSKGLELLLTSQRWHELDRLFNSPQFGAVLVLGNSLCLTQDSATRALCITQFFKVLEPGGRLIIDERNFTYILTDRDRILADPVGKFRFSRKYMYCGDNVRGVPQQISDERVTFLYYNNPAAKTLKQANAAKIGTLEMYPFKKGELRELLTDAGFERVDVFSDFEPGLKGDADFFTYVATKPGAPIARGQILSPSSPGGVRHSEVRIGGRKVGDVHRPSRYDEARHDAFRP